MIQPSQRLFIIDNQNDFPATLSDVANENELKYSEVRLLLNLNVNESCFIGICEVKRIK